MKFAAGGHTDSGRKRSYNEDAMIGDPDLGLYAVIDGMGGPPAGELAAATASNVVSMLIAEQRDRLAQMREKGAEAGDVIDLVASTMQTACRQVHKTVHMQHDGKGAATMSLVLLAGRFAVIGHVGEGRVYLVRDGAVHRLTEDHVRMQQLENGKSRKIVRRSLGVQDSVDVDTLVIELMPRDVLLLCTDGVSMYFTDEDIADCCRKVSYEHVPQQLINAANARGGSDNLTAIAVFVESVRMADVDPAQQIKVLKKIPLFKALDYRELLKICDVLRIVDYTHGQRILEDGETGSDLYILLKGKAVVSKLGQTLAELPTGAFFGEGSLLDDEPRGADVVAEGDVKAMVIRRTDLMAVFDADPALGVKALWSLARVLNTRLRKTSGELTWAKSSF